MIKFALKNIKSKPLRVAGTVLSIAVVVAMIFCMLSFKNAVYEFIYASETASAGSSDIVILTKSDSDRITNVSAPLINIDGIEEIIPSMSVYAVLNGEYIQIRGYEDGKTESLQKINYIEKDTGNMNSDSVIISSSCAEHFSLNIGDRIALTLGSNSASFYVYGIAENSGYFLSDSPFQFVGRNNQVAKLASGTAAEGICNAIYIKVSPDADTESVMESIKAIEAYRDLSVEIAKDEKYIEEQTNSLTAPVVLSGAAVMALGIVFIAILFMMTSKEKVRLVAKYKAAGATNRQVLTMFVAENIIIAALGAVIGSLLSVGLFVAILKLTLSSLTVFSVNALKLFGAAAIGFIVSMAASLVPALKAFKGTVRENQISTERTSGAGILIPVIAVILTVISVIIEFLIESVTAVFAVVTMALALLSLGICVGYILRLLGKLLIKSSSPSLKYASAGISREKRFTKSVTLLSVGMTVSMMLFMAWSLTTQIFDGYIDNFKNMIFISNIQASQDIDEIREQDLVKGATKMVWDKGTLKTDDVQKNINILGSKDVLDMLDFKYISSENDVKAAVSSAQPYVIVDIAMQKLYGVKVGDSIKLTVQGIEKDVIIGGILQHELFSGNYVIISSEILESVFGIKADTILVVSSGDTSQCANNLRTAFSKDNYFVVEVLEAFKWERSSMDAVFSMIGTIAIVVALFIFVVTVTSSLIGRSSASKERSAMLAAGMSKGTLLKTELIQYAVTALISFIISFAVSVLLTSSLIHALRLFGLYFEFMYEAWVVAVSGIVMAVLYSLVPVAMNFKKEYNIRKL